MVALCVVCVCRCLYGCWRLYVSVYSVCLSLCVMLLLVGGVSVFVIVYACVSVILCFVIVFVFE